MTKIKYSNPQRLIASIFYILIVISCIITIGGTVATIADLIMAEGKMELFQGLSLGYQIAIIATLLAGLFFLLIIFYGLYKKGIKFLLRSIFKEREIPEEYRNRLGVKIVAGGLMVCIFAIILGLIFALAYEILLGTFSQTFQFVGGFSSGQVVLFIGIMLFMIIGLIFSFVFLWNNGYYVVIKTITRMEEED